MMLRSQACALSSVSCKGYNDKVRPMLIELGTKDSVEDIDYILLFHIRQDCHRISDGVKG
jgi:hypothetical protein